MVIPFIEYEGNTSDCAQIVSVFNALGEQTGWIKMDEDGVIVDFIPKENRLNKDEEAVE